MYEQEDQTVSDTKNKQTIIIKIEFCFSITDTAIAAVDDKFNYISVLNENSGVYIMYLYVLWLAYVYCLHNTYELQKNPLKICFKTI